MSEKFTHYLVTRFNLTETRWKTDAYGQPTLDGDWYRHRLELFEKWCVAGVTHQTSRNFTWLIFCSPDTPRPFLENLHAILNSLPNSRIVLADGQEDMRSQLREMATSSVTPFVITSRLDNDDALHADFIQIIQHHFREKHLLLLHPDEGIQLDIHRRVATVMRSGAENAFTSLIEQNDPDQPFRSVYGFAHNALPGDIAIQRIRGFGPLWIKILHTRNVRSQLKGIPLLTFPKDAFPFLPSGSTTLRLLPSLRYILRRWMTRR